MLIYPVLQNQKADVIEKTNYGKYNPIKDLQEKLRLLNYQLSQDFKGSIKSINSDKLLGFRNSYGGVIEKLRHISKSLDSIKELIITPAAESIGIPQNLSYSESKIESIYYYQLNRDNFEKQEEIFYLDKFLVKYTVDYMVEKMGQLIFNKSSSDSEDIYPLYKILNPFECDNVFKYYKVNSSDFIQEYNYIKLLDKISKILTFLNEYVKPKMRDYINQIVSYQCNTLNNKFQIKIDKENVYVFINNKLLAYYLFEKVENYLLHREQNNQTIVDFNNKDYIDLLGLFFYQEIFTTEEQWMFSKNKKSF